MDRKAQDSPVQPLRWMPPSNWVEYQPLPIRLACYTIAWAFVVMLILALFLPLAVGGVTKAVSF